MILLDILRVDCVRIINAGNDSNKNMALMMAAKAILTMAFLKSQLYCNNNRNASVFLNYFRI